MEKNVAFFKRKEKNRTFRTEKNAVPNPGSTPLHSQVDGLLKEFLGLLNKGNKTPHPKHDVEQVIKTTCCPMFARSSSLDPDKLKTAKEEFRKLELAGIIRRSISS